MVKIDIRKMSEFEVGARERFRALSLGPIPWGFWSWTFHDGSCWAAALEVGGNIVGWAAVTLETDYLPVVGVFIDEGYRGQGLANTAVVGLLSALREGPLRDHKEVAAALHRWSGYTLAIERAGFVAIQWE